MKYIDSKYLSREKFDDYDRPVESACDETSKGTYGKILEK